MENTYKAYVQAWKIKDIAAPQNLISGDYMAVNFENRVSRKEIEIATAKNDAEWETMNVDEIHVRVFGASAIASGSISAQGKKTDGAPFTARCGSWRFWSSKTDNGKCRPPQSAVHAIVAMKVPQYSPN